MLYLHINKEFSRRSGGEFTVSRSTQIFPAVIVVVVILFAIGLVDTDYPFAMPAFDFARHLFLMGPVGVFWSVLPEIQFYLIFVLMWWFVFLLTCMPFLMAVFLFFVVFALAVSRLYSERISGILVFSKTSYFIVGVFAGWLRSRTSRINPLATFWGYIFVFSFMVILFNGPSDYRNDNFWMHHVHALWAGLFFFILAYESPVSRVLLSNWLMLRMGRWSFSFYFLHVPIIYFVVSLLDVEVWVLYFEVVLSVFLLYLNYEYIEILGGNIINNIGARFTERLGE